MDTETNQPFFTIRDVVLEIRGDVKGLKEAVGTLSNSFEGVKDTQKDHETRIRSVEKKLWLLAGAGAATGAIGGTVTQLLGF